jgi:hypothetical protein
MWDIINPSQLQLRDPYVSLLLSLSGLLRKIQGLAQDPLPLGSFLQPP